MKIEPFLKKCNVLYWPERDSVEPKHIGSVFSMLNKNEESLTVKQCVRS